MASVNYKIVQGASGYEIEFTEVGSQDVVLVFNSGSGYADLPIAANGTESVPYAFPLCWACNPENPVELVAGEASKVVISQDLSSPLEVGDTVVFQVSVTNPNTVAVMLTETSGLTNIGSVMVPANGMHQFNYTHSITQAEIDALEVSCHMNFQFDGPDNSQENFLSDDPGTPAPFDPTIVALPDNKVSLGELLAVPGLIGHGTDTATGGRGGPTYKVTNLNDSGPGSFRDAVSTGSGPRAIVFAVGGRSSQLSEITARADLTVFGQTAPGRGFETHWASTASFQDVIRLRGSNNIWQNIGVVGDPTYDPFNISGDPTEVSDIVLYRLSVTGGDDELLQAWKDFRRITIAECILAEPGDGGGGAYKGPLLDASNRTINSGELSFFRNFMSDGIGRAPFFAGLTKFDQYNNAAYNFGNWRAQYRDDGQIVQGNHFSNYYEHGPNSPAGLGIGRDINMLVSGGGALEIWVDDNYNATLGTYDNVNNPQFWSPPAQAYTDCPLMPDIWPGNQVKAMLPSVVGPRNQNAGLWTSDIRRLTEWQNGTGSWLTDVDADVRPTTLTNSLMDVNEPDGVPPAYKQRCGFALGSDLNTIIGADGYSELERWIYTGMPQQ